MSPLWWVLLFATPSIEGFPPWPRSSLTCAARSAPSWELSTLAAEWHRIYGETRPDLARALEFYDRWLPGTMRRITGTSMPHCVTLRSPGDWTARPGYR